MGKKRALGQDAAKVEQSAKFWCYYCGSEARDNTALIRHQQAKHFRCPECDPKSSGGHCRTLSGLFSHLRRSHGKELDKVPGAIEGRTDVGIDVYGMIGIPVEALEVEEDAAADGNPPPPPAAKLPPEPASAPLGQAASALPALSSVAPPLAVPGVTLPRPAGLITPLQPGLPQARPAAPLTAPLPTLTGPLSALAGQLSSLTAPLSVAGLAPAPAPGASPAPAPAADLLRLVGAAGLDLSALTAISSITAPLPTAPLPAAPLPTASLGLPPVSPAPSADLGSAVDLMATLALLSQVYGRWQHSAGGDITVTAGTNNSVVVRHFLLGEQTLAVSDFISGGKLRYCKHEGTFSPGLILWSNGSVWTKVN